MTMTFAGLLDPADDRPQAPSHDHAASLAAALAADRQLHLGFPGATDLVFPELGAILTGQLLNNVGDPFEPGHGRNHTKPYETAVIRQLGALFGADHHVWGYVTTGSTEGTIAAVHEAATEYPDLVVYASTAAHYSVAKAASLVRAQLVQIRADPAGRIQLDELRDMLTRFRDRPAVIIATVGTTEQEAVDDVAGIAGLCDDLGVTRRRIHVDAALAGIPLALLPEHERPAFGFGAGATSLVVSGHKFLSTLMPCAVLLYPRRPQTHTAAAVSYIGAPDTTITGSRSGHTPLLLHWALQGQGLDGHRHRADNARHLAAYTHDRLQRLGWRSHWAWPAFTITLDQPTRPLRQPWVLGGDRRTGRIITMPGIDRDWIDEFCDDLEASHRGRPTVVPNPRRPAGQGTTP